MDRNETLIGNTRTRARDLFDSKQYNCAESAFQALNETFGGGLKLETAARIATGLGGGLGATGGTCGALTGCVLALGLLAECDPEVLRKKTIYPLAADLGLETEADPDLSADRRYPRVTVQEVIDASPELILIPDDPYQFSGADKEKIFQQFAATSAVINKNVHFIDGSLITWDGVRLGAALQKLSEYFIV